MDEKQEDNTNLIDLDSIGQLTPEVSEYVTAHDVKEYLSPEPFMDELLHSTPETIDDNVFYDVEQLSEDDVKKKIVKELLNRKKMQEKIDKISDEHYSTKS